MHLTFLPPAPPACIMARATSPATAIVGASLRIPGHPFPVPLAGICGRATSSRRARFLHPAARCCLIRPGGFRVAHWREVSRRFIPTRPLRLHRSRRAGGLTAFGPFHRCAMTDDWKGEHLISAKPKTQDERSFITRSASSGISHRRRQAEGCNQSRSGGPWAKSIAQFHNIRRRGVHDGERV